MLTCAAASEAAPPSACVREYGTLTKKRPPRVEKSTRVQRGRGNLGTMFDQFLQFRLKAMWSTVTSRAGFILATGAGAGAFGVLVMGLKSGNLTHQQVSLAIAAAGGLIIGGMALGSYNTPGMSVGGSVWSLSGRPVAGPKHEAKLPEGKHDLQLYSLATPNGIKVTVLLEELGVPYDAHFINIFKNEQFGSEFTAANPNSKIPTLIDKRPSFGSNPVNVFESCNILRYLCDKHPSSLYPTDPAQRLECDNWLFFQHGCVGPYFGQFGHFYCYAPCKLPYAIDRYTKEMQRVLSVIDRQLGTRDSICSFGYSIADIATFPWVLCITQFYKAGDWVGMDEFPNVQRWMKHCLARPSATLGLKVNSMAKEDSEFANYSTK